jgi:hypothetical protein
MSENSCGEIFFTSYCARIFWAAADEDPPFAGEMAAVVRPALAAAGVLFRPWVPSPE